MLRSAAVPAAAFAISCTIGIASAQTYGGAGPEAGAAGDASASRRQQQTLRRPLSVVPSLAIDETYTDNVDLKPADQRRSDFVTVITPSLAIDEASARTSLNGTISMPTLIYARTGGENDRVIPQVNLLGRVEALEQLAFVEGQVYVSQDYFSPFGGRPASLVNLTENEFITQLYRISPYIRGDAAGALHYELRDDNIWSKQTSTPISTQSSYTNQALASIRRDPLPVGWSAEYNRTQVKFENQPQTYLTEYVRARAFNRPREHIELSAGVGYENNRFPLSESKGFTYSVGARWRPSERTALDAFWEHRFFGSSYHVSFDQRTPLTVWRIGASRDTTSYPQQLASLPTGSIVPLLLNSLFASSIPDPVARAEFVLQFMQNRGLPFVLESPYTIYNQQIFLEERANATVGLIGARNSLFFTAFRLRTEPITAAGTVLPPLFQLGNNNTQLGGGVSWTYQLTAIAQLNAGADYLRTTANGPLETKTEQTNARLSVVSPISNRTSMTYGVRWQDFRSNISDSWREFAAFVGITHTFR